MSVPAGWEQLLHFPHSIVESTGDRRSGCEDTSVSGLWTPTGEHEPEPAEGTHAPGPAPAAGAGPPGEGELDDAALAEELQRVRAELAATPVAEIVANHAVGLWQLAVLHLAPDDGAPRLDEASLAIDAMAGVVEAAGDRLGDYAEPLLDALAQLRLAFVQVRDGGVPGGPEAPGAPDSPGA